MDQKPEALEITFCEFVWSDGEMSFAKYLGGLDWKNYTSCHREESMPIMVRHVWVNTIWCLFTQSKNLVAYIASDFPNRVFVLDDHVTQRTIITCYFDKEKKGAVAISRVPVF